ncbi:hypothetical protein E2C01_012106 [Portunus trituberculatus]|uniref:Uncharacterized protein n=1 Tax=Portunus trituberculatus TaxID=210409 RepID=A0A5B7DD51_PORTR|nr:hypothetical protein [Portunus trituberculatus]
MPRHRLRRTNGKGQNNLTWSIVTLGQYTNIAVRNTGGLTLFLRHTIRLLYSWSSIPRLIIAFKLIRNLISYPVLISSHVEMPHIPVEVASNGPATQLVQPPGLHGSSARRETRPPETASVIQGGLKWAGGAIGHHHPTEAQTRCHGEIPQGKSSVVRTGESYMDPRQPGEAANKW